MKDETKKLLDEIKERLVKIAELEPGCYVTTALMRTGRGWVSCQLNDEETDVGYIVFAYNETFGYEVEE